MVIEEFKLINKARIKTLATILLHAFELFDVHYCICSKTLSVQIHKLCNNTIIN